MIAIALLLVVGVSIGATLLFTRDGDGPSNPPTTGAPSDIASANDTGPVAIITEEPTCKAFNTINNGLADIESNGWGDLRGTLGPATEWTPEQRLRVEAVANAMRNAADQAVRLATQTPHRVVRELYAQFIASGRAYAERVKDYAPNDDGLAAVNVNASGALIGICNSIEFDSAGRSLALPAVEPPTKVASSGNPSDPQIFIEAPDSTCTEWIDRLDTFNSSTPDWQRRDGSVAAIEWTSERRALEQATIPLLNEYADEISAVGRASGNPVMEDFAVTSALYIRAYVSSVDTYTRADSWLIHTGFRIANLVSGACRAAAG